MQNRRRSQSKAQRITGEIEMTEQEQIEEIRELMKLLDKCVSFAKELLDYQMETIK